MSPLRPGVEPWLLEAIEPWLHSGVWLPETIEAWLPAGLPGMAEPPGLPGERRRGRLFGLFICWLERLKTPH